MASPRNNQLNECNGDINSHTEDWIGRAYESLRLRQEVRGLARASLVRSSSRPLLLWFYRHSLTGCLFYSTVGMTAAVPVRVLPSITVRLSPTRFVTKARLVALSTATA